MNKLLLLLLGLILLLVPIYAWGIGFAGFGQAALIFLKGGLMWLLMLVGLGFIVFSIKEL